jgi:hypothetical protein
VKGTEPVKTLDAIRSKPVATRKLEATAIILNGIVVRTPIASNTFMFGNFEPKISSPNKYKKNETRINPR